MITVPHAMVQRSTCCSMCHDVFKDPRILLCGHTFCQICLANQQTRSMKKPQCVVCQKFWSPPAINLLKNEAVASVCDTISAALSGDYINDSSSFNLIEEESCRACSHHSDQKMIYFCKSCAESLCPRCVIKSHNGHDCVEIADYCKELDQILLEKQNEHKTIEKSLKDQIAELQARLAEVASIVRRYEFLLSGDAKLVEKVQAATDRQSVSDNDRQSSLFNAKVLHGSLEPERDWPTTATVASKVDSAILVELCNDNNYPDESNTIYTGTEAEQQEDEICYQFEATSSIGTLTSTAPSERLQQQLLKSGTLPAKAVQSKLGVYRNDATRFSANERQCHPECFAELYCLFEPYGPEDARNEFDLTAYKPYSWQWLAQKDAKVSVSGQSGVNSQSHQSICQVDPAASKRKKKQNQSRSGASSQKILSTSHTMTMM
jgi:hypothetical protein